LIHSWDGTGLDGPALVTAPRRHARVFDIHYIGAGLAVFASAHLTQKAVTAAWDSCRVRSETWRDGLAEIVEYSGVVRARGRGFRIRWPRFIRDTFGETFAAFGLRPRGNGQIPPVEKVFSYTPWAIIIAGVVLTA